MRKKTTADIEAQSLFESAMKGVRVLAQNKIRLIPSPAKKRVASPAPKAESNHFHFSEGDYLKPVQGDDYLAFNRPNLHHKTLRNLRKGQYNVEAILDLHGKTIDESRVNLDAFLQRCLATHARVVLIIHGKGNPNAMPILKNKLNHWLRETPSVLAFCSAEPHAGGRGALYVLLKHSTGERSVE